MRIVCSLDKQYNMCYISCVVKKSWILLEGILSFIADIIENVPGDTYAERIKSFRAKYNLTQQALAERIGVSFATVNRWENNQTKPSQLSWKRLKELEREYLQAKLTKNENRIVRPTIMDFTANPERVKLLAEGERLSFGHLVNPSFATEISNIDPLPHQRIAVYDHMMKHPRLRFLLADDAGAGKTIMTGLYIREMIARRILDRILIITPAGLVGNWKRELQNLFNLPFNIISGSDARNENPFCGDQSNRIIISIDTLSSDKMFACMQDSNVLPYELAVFDEAHKLSVDRTADLRIRPTRRYLLAEAFAGVETNDSRWQLNWSVNHLILLTATPHMGKDYPYYGLWRLLEPDIITTLESFHEFPPEQRQKHFIRRTKEEMVKLDGTPLYKTRISDTLGYSLTQGDISEQKLYEETTEYLRVVYNHAKMLNREAARLAMSVFQRRLASSTYALLRSYERRIDKLNKLILDIQDGIITPDQLTSLQQRLGKEEDVFDQKTADDESSTEGLEENEIIEDRLLQGVVAASLADLIAEKEQVQSLLDLTKMVYENGHESKFDKLREVITDKQFSGEKFIIFTEHRDTLNFLIRRLEGLGYTGQVAQIHGGMDYKLRELEVERFRKQHKDNGARFLVCTDAAGEGINLQFCWIMINYDIPWNPARLEQRMGRIHRYGQEHDPVVILNFVATTTREGKVLKTLLDKLEKIRKELKSDKVFDCIGRVFQDVSIKRYMEMAVTGDTDEITLELDGRLTKEQIQAIASREESLYGSNGDVARELPRIRENIEQEVFFRLLPGYIRQYVQAAASMVNIEIEGDLADIFSLRPMKQGATDSLLPALENYQEDIRDRLTISLRKEKQDAIWMRPGEQLFESLRALVRNQLSEDGLRGAVFVDPMTDVPYLFHLALMSIVRKADHEIEVFAQDEVLECRLVGVKQCEGAEITLHPVEHLLLLKGGSGLPPGAQRLAVNAENQKQFAESFLTERVAREMALELKNILIRDIPERELFIRRGFDYQEADLATARIKHNEKARKGNRKAIRALEDVKRQQKQLGKRKEQALHILNREHQLILPGEIKFIAHALVVPSSDPVDMEQHDVNVEMAAMKVAQAFEEAAGAKVLDVHTPELARAAGLQDNPGFDLLSIRPNNEKRAIEVKGRGKTGDVEVSANEWAKACNLRDGYWIYAVYDCATPSPRFFRVQDPFGKLLAKSKGSVMIKSNDLIKESIKYEI